MKDFEIKITGFPAKLIATLGITIIIIEIIRFLLFVIETIIHN